MRQKYTLFAIFMMGAGFAHAVTSEEVKQATETLATPKIQTPQDVRSIAAYYQKMVKYIPGTTFRTMYFQLAPEDVKRSVSFTRNPDMFGLAIFIEDPLHKGCDFMLADTDEDGNVNWADWGCGGVTKDNGEVFFGFFKDPEDTSFFTGVKNLYNRIILSAGIEIKQ